MSLLAVELEDPKIGISGKGFTEQLVNFNDCTMGLGLTMIDNLCTNYKEYSCDIMKALLFTIYKLWKLLNLL